MCTSRSSTNQQQQQSNNMNGNYNNYGGWNLYPDLSGFENNNQQQQQQQPSILQFLQALGLAPPPGGPNDNMTEPSSSRPPPPASASTPPPSAPPPQAEEAGQGSEQPAASNGQQQRQQQQQQHQQQFQGFNDAFWENWWWNPNNQQHHQQQFNPSQQQQQQRCPCSSFAFVRHFLANLGQVVRNSVRATSTLFGLLLVWLLIPSCLLQGAAFLVLASGLGLPLPVLLAGQVLRTAVGCLGAAEPLLLVGLTVWALHKIAVRRQPLVDRSLWGARWNQLRRDIYNQCNNYQFQQRQHQH